MLQLKNIWVVILFCASNLLQAQKGHPILDDLDVFEVSGKVFISVTISSGNTCNGITVERSTDSLIYNEVGSVAGVCGSSSTPVTYNFTDEKPVKNKKSYYRVELGGNGFTDVISILVIDTKEFGFQVRPNPANEKAIIYFENPQQDQFELVVYDFLGAKILVKTTTNNSFELNTSNYNKGFYVFSISQAHDQQKTIGKLMVQH